MGGGGGTGDQHFFFCLLLSPFSNIYKAIFPIAPDTSPSPWVSAGWAQATNSRRYFSQNSIWFCWQVQWASGWCGGVHGTPSLFPTTGLGAAPGPKNWLGWVGWPCHQEARCHLSTFHSLRPLPCGDPASTLPPCPAPFGSHANDPEVISPPEDPEVILPTETP